MTEPEHILCNCGHDIHEHNNADSCGVAMCRCRVFEEQEEA